MSELNIAGMARNRLTDIRDRVMLPAISNLDNETFGLPPYGRGGIVLLEYLEDKQATGLIESVAAGLPPEVVVKIQLCAGAYRDVIEPWLEEFVHLSRVRCNIAAWHLPRLQPDRDLTRVELRNAAPDTRVLAAMEVTPYFKGGGRFEYGGPDYKYVIR